LVIYASLASVESLLGNYFIHLWEVLPANFLSPAIFFLSSLVFIVYNPIYALISLICLFLGAAFFLISIGAEFLGMIYLIIYIGAIAILFLFVIMMFNLRDLQDKISKVQDQDFFQISFTLYILAMAKFYQLFSENILDIIGQNFSHNKILIAKYFLIQGWTETLYNSLIYNLLETWTDARVSVNVLPEQLYFFLKNQYLVMPDIWTYSNVFYSYYAYSFFLAGLILLTAMVGAIILALSTTEKDLR
jgi:NADH:ubiquinone oxidoreductase subunit 6 (subunit J)